tara:strand:- start:108 stop:887 length:780 start_codon:yes stop_codon:yes gene_type:complete
MDTPKILKVKDREGVKYKPLHPHLPQPCACVLHCSPVKTGKSTIISNLLLSDQFYGQDYFDRVKVMSNTIMNDDTSRFIKDAFDVEDHYEDRFVDDLIASQNKFDKEEMPSVALICDDLLGSIRREARINHLASRFRHYNIQLLYYSSQSFRKVNNVVRQNATNVIIGSPFPNTKELGKIAEEYGDMFGGMNNFLKIYAIATPNKYDFLHLDLQENPPVAYHNFEKVVAIGDKINGDSNIDISNLEDKNEECDCEDHIK